MRDIKQFCDVILGILNNPDIYNITTLAWADYAELGKSDAGFYVEMSDKDILTGKFILRILLSIIYVDITHLAKNILMKNFLVSYIRTSNVTVGEIMQHTKNHKQLSTHLEYEDDNNYYLYVTHFISFLKLAIGNKETATFGAICETYVKPMMPKVVLLAYIVGRLNEGPQTSFRNPITEMIKESSVNNVVTYIRIRKNEGSMISKRFMNLKTNSSSLTFDYTNTDTAMYDPVSGAALALSRLEYQSYLIGPVTRVFGPQKNNVDIAKQVPEIKKALESLKPVFVLGYGASGAGKTSTLVYFNGAKDINLRPGILMHLCNSMGSSYKGLDIRCIEFYNNGRSDIERECTFFTSNNNSNNSKSNNGNTNINSSKLVGHQHMSFEYDLNTDPRKIGEYTSKSDYIYEPFHSQRAVALFDADSKTGNIERLGHHGFTFKKNAGLGQVLSFLIDNDRFVKSTTNNTNSSRSHTVVFIKFLKLENDNNARSPLLIVGDFAGVENKFDCASDEILTRFMNRFADKMDNIRFYSKFNYGLDNEDYQSDCKNDNDPMYRLGDSLNLPLSPRLVKDLTTALLDMYSGGMRRTLPEVTDVNEFDRIVYGSMVMARIKAFFEALIAAKEGSKGLKYSRNHMLFVPAFIRESLDNIYKQCVGMTSDTTKNRVLAYVFKDLDKIVEYARNFVLTGDTGTQEKMLLLEPHNPYYNEYEDILGERGHWLIMPELFDDDESINQWTKYFINPENNLLPTNYLQDGQVMRKSNKVNNNRYNLLHLKDSNSPSGVSKFLISKRYYHNNRKEFARRFENHKESAIRSLRDDTNNADDFVVVQLPMSVIRRNVPIHRSIYNVVSLFFSNGLNGGKQNEMDEFIERAFTWSIDQMKNVRTDITRTHDALVARMRSRVCKMNIAKKVCDRRVKEGVSINASLEDARVVISDILVQKNANRINIAPMFERPCLHQYKKNGRMFALDRARKNSIPSQVFKRIEGFLEVNGKYELSDLVISVMCVLNVDKSVDMYQPAVPYIDVNPILYIINTLEEDVDDDNEDDAAHAAQTGMQSGNRKHLQARVQNGNEPSQLAQLCQALDARVMQVANELTALVEYTEFKAWFTEGASIYDTAPLSIFMQKIDMWNAASPMGTLEFIDRLAKMNATNVVCHGKDTVQDAIKGADQMTLKGKFLKLS